MKLRSLVHIRSFTLRVALLSAAVSGAVLAVFGGLTYAAVQRISLQRFDEVIREFGHRHLVEPRGPRHWDRVSDSLRFFLGEEENTFLLLVKTREEALLHASSNWPADLPTDDFPAPSTWASDPDRADRPGLPGRGPAGGPPRGHPDKAPGRGKGFRPPPGAPPMRPPPNHPPGAAGPGRRGGTQGRPAGGPPQQPRPPVPLKMPEFSTRTAGGTEWRLGVMGNPDITLVLGLNMNRLKAEMAPVRRALLTALLIALLFVAVGAWWIARRALKPVAALTAAIQRVKGEGLDQRIGEHDQDREFAELIAVFNDMMEWLEKSFKQAIRFSADASHELKTPLTVLQVHLEQAVHAAEPGSDEQRRYESLAKELQRLKSITQKLLLLSRIDAGELKLNLRPLNLSELVAAIVEDTEILAPHIEVESELAEGLWVMADADLMKQMIQNLAANAIKYNRKGGSIRVKLDANAQVVRLAVANSGRGIPPEDRDKVFTRFYRGDKARSRRVGGAGLGLSLAREIVRAHRGELVLEDTREDSTAFSMRLPRAEAEGQPFAGG